MEDRKVLAVLTKSFFYLSLVVLAYACIQTANSMNESSGKCTQLSLILIITSLFATTCATVYNLNQLWLLISITPMVIGIALWLIVTNVEIHHKLDKFMSAIKNALIDRVWRV